jgi:hypothetical protein
MVHGQSDNWSAIVSDNTVGYVDLSTAGPPGC